MGIVGLFHCTQSKVKFTSFRPFFRLEQYYINLYNEEVTWLWISIPVAESHSLTCPSLDAVTAAHESLENDESVNAYLSPS